MPCPINHSPDPFEEARKKDGVLVNNFQGYDVPMVLRHGDLREACKDWEKFSSDAPMRVPIPTEEAVRTVRQLPLEIDPPFHADYREIAEPFFMRAKLPDVISRVESMMSGKIDEALKRDQVEVVYELAIPMQSLGLAALLNMPDSEADVWISWGMHVLREGDGVSRGAELERYMNSLFDQADPNGDSFFSVLPRSEFRGRKLTREECLGFSSIMFAGGRDTIINSITGVIGHLAANSKDLEFLREDPRRIVHASEEFFRAISPVTHIGRVCPHATEVKGVPVAENSLMSLCFASANYDETVFDSPKEVQLDRKPNPHIAFGFGPHLCLGAPHARLVVRTLLKVLCEKVGKLETLASEPRLEREEHYTRILSYNKLQMRFVGK